MDIEKIADEVLQKAASGLERLEKAFQDLDAKHTELHNAIKKSAAERKAAWTSFKEAASAKAELLRRGISVAKTVKRVKSKKEEPVDGESSATDDS